MNEFIYQSEAFYLLILFFVIQLVYNLAYQNSVETWKPYFSIFYAVLLTIVSVLYVKGIFLPSIFSKNIFLNILAILSLIIMVLYQGISLYRFLKKEKQLKSDLFYK